MKNRGARGEKISKLKSDMVLKIRQFSKDGMTQEELSKVYDVSQPTISRILLRKTWKHI